MKKDTINTTAINKAIEIAGGASKLSRLLDITYQTVIFWKNGRFTPNPLNCAKIEKITEGKVKREDILPDYPWEKFNSEDKKDEKSEIAKKMLGMGMSKENISEATGLSIEAIEKLED